MTHPPGWTADEPCPACGSHDITEFEIRIGAGYVRMGWECRDCGHAATWTARPAPPGAAGTDGHQDGER